MTNNKITDLDYLRDISTGDNQMVIEMIEVFLEGYREALSDMRELNQEGNWEELRARAHKFKPNLAYMGISKGTEKILQLEEQAKNNEPPVDIGSTISELSSICEEASGELQQELKNLNVT
ncbi:Hpt domain-containing protein [Balneolaceae bacterium YR4-1]|uniref:Hpt domain-containing protein n=1 Tax=Halalkalibaculum roseum TaxID=2709311 RepID=A0A6M1T570_9BACT|nr:Hpt domain-containing protein [Halalkalibaculum roseum]NGP75483.1 Hpt domain-containing protein [Halalkalibaculum roseum]